MSKELMERIVIAVVDALHRGDPIVTLKIGERNLIVEWEQPDLGKSQDRDDPW